MQYIYSIHIRNVLRSWYDNEWGYSNRILPSKSVVTDHGLMGDFQAPANVEGSMKEYENILKPYINIYHIYHIYILFFRCIQNCVLSVFAHA